MKRSKSEAKTVVILARYVVKATKAVCFLVRNGEGKEYCVTRLNGRYACTCEAFSKGHGKHQCYHVTHCIATEQARIAQKRVESTKLASAVSSTVVTTASSLTALSCGSQRETTAHAVDCSPVQSVEAKWSLPDWMLRGRAQLSGRAA